MWNEQLVGIAPKLSGKRSDQLISGTILQRSCLGISPSKPVNPSHPYLAEDCTRHFFTRLERLEVGVPDAEKVWEFKRRK